MTLLSTWAQSILNTIKSLPKSPLQSSPSQPASFGTIYFCQDSYFVLRILCVGSWEMAQLIKCLPYKHEDLSLGSQHSYKNQVFVFLYFSLPLQNLNSGLCAQQASILLQSYIPSHCFFKTVSVCSLSCPSTQYVAQLGLKLVILLLLPLELQGYSFVPLCAVHARGPRYNSQKNNLYSSVFMAI